MGRSGLTHSFSEPLGSIPASNEGVLDVASLPLCLYVQEEVLPVTLGLDLKFDCVASRQRAWHVVGLVRFVSSAFRFCVFMALLDRTLEVWILEIITEKCPEFCVFGA